MVQFYRSWQWFARFGAKRCNYVFYAPSQLLVPLLVYSYLLCHDSDEKSTLVESYGEWGIVVFFFLVSDADKQDSELF